ncbi:MAG: Tol-Pal system beta propeller repeat protein TolB [Pseudomonadales bacterium]|nr:Tol-Pal system beta propeller repeat protein TolB [Pseudomonadales bacterium]
MRELVAILLVALALSAQGFEIIIDRGTDNPTVIAVVPFGGLPEGREIAAIVSADLLRSGLFTPIEPRNMLNQPTAPREVFFRDWQIIRAEYLVVGTVDRSDTGSLVLEYHLMDVGSERTIASKRVDSGIEWTRDLAHFVADEIFLEITGVRGAFSTKLVYVLAQGVGTADARYRLQRADFDGERAVTLLESPEPILSPAWDARGERVAYVSFESGRSAVYVHTIGTGQRTLVAQHKGTNSAPAFSPDGQFLAVTLSRDENPEIYTIELETGVLRRITQNDVIDTEPVWMANGRTLVYTSDRGGAPQIYSISLDTLAPRRMTHQGNYNARPRLLPNGEHMVYVHRSSDGRYRIAWQQLTGRRELRLLSETRLDESPSVAPNGSMVAYATKRASKSILMVVSIDGQMTFRLPSSEGEVLEPAWSPYLTSSIESQDL